MKTNQPYRITHNGKKFTRFSKFKDLGNGISEGPFYKLNGDTEGKWLYMPDLAFTNGVTETPVAMHRIQATAF